MRIPQVLIAGVLLAPLLFAQPVISNDGVVSAASYVPTGFPHSGIARGSFFSVFGQNLGPADGQVVTSLPLQTSLNGTSVRVTVGETTVDALIHYTSASQINAVLPSRTPAGDGTLTVTYAGTSAAAPIHVVNRSFGIFTRNMAGRGPAIIQNFVSQSEQPLNGLGVAAQPGQIAILWGTGLGPISGDDSVAPTAGNLTSDVQVLVGGQSATVLYAGRSPQFPGIDQINFQVPATAEGCYVPIALKVEGAIGNYGTMAISTGGGTCSDPTTMSAADLSAVTTQGAAKVGIVSLNRVRAKAGDFEVKIDEGRAEFYQRSIAQLNASPYLYEYSTSLGTCLTYTQHASGSEYDAVPQDPTQRLGLNAGTALNISGPEGAKQLETSSPGLFDNTQLGGGFGGPILPEYLVAGHYTVDNGTGGTDVGSFSAGIDLQPTLTWTNNPWTNKDNISSISRTEGLKIQWAGGDPDKEFVVIVGLSVNTTSQISGSFVCAARPADGQFTVPASILSHLPVTTPWTGDGNPTGMLTVATQPLPSAVKFSAPGLDAAYFTYSAQLVALVNFN